jgi:hypothetical protein
MEIAIMKPVLVQAALTFFMLFWMAKERVGAVRAGTVIRNATGVRPTWVGRAGIVSNSFHNQLEMPMMFFAGVLFALVTNAVDDVMLWLAWAYVILRLVHAAIHTTYNKIPHRFAVYAVSNIVLLAIWVKLALHVFAAG